MPARRINFTCQPNPLPLLQRDLATAAKIQANVPNLRRYGINSDVIVVGWGAALVCLQGFQGKQCPSRASSACLRHASCTCAAQNGMQRLGHARLRPGRRRHSGLDSGATMSLPPPPPLQAPSRPVNQSWFSGRSLVITPQQSSAIVAALQQLGVLDANGWLRDDPRQGLKASRSISQAVQQQWAAA